MCDLKDLFINGKTYDEFINSLADDKRNRFKDANIEVETFDTKVRYVLAFSEGWCPDCQHNLPILKAITDKFSIELRIVPKEDNESFMEDFIVDGQARIPTLVFMDSSFNVVGSWIERPEEVKRLWKEGPHIKERYLNGEFDKEIINEIVDILK
ncbi:MAG: thioredoxin family protein [Thermoanaerobacteraceae bacterium]|nr:thioredoxin family protein [Thermoanaerobacteraceae bacterium]